MPITYMNRKGVMYTLYQGQTKTGKLRYYFGRVSRSEGEPVTQLPPGFTISESINGVVSLVKDRPPLIQPEEVAVVEAVLQQHPEARRYRVAVKQKRIEVYEQVSPDYETILRQIYPVGFSRPGFVERMWAEEERNAQYMPMLRFNLLDSAQRLFGAERMCYRSSVDGWLDLRRGEPIAKLARALIPTLNTDEFYELF